MIPYRGDQYDRFNAGPPINRPMMFVAYSQQQHPQLFQSGPPVPPLPPPPPSSMMFASAGPQFHQGYPGHPPVLHGTHVFIPNTPVPPPQSWILSAPPAPPVFRPAPPSFNAVPPQPLAFNHGSVSLKRKSHYLDESDYDRLAPVDHEPSGLIGMPRAGYPPNHFQQQPQQQQQLHFRPPDRTRFPSQPPPPPPLRSHGDAFIPSMPRPPWPNADPNHYPPPLPPPVPLPTPDDEQRKALTTQLFQKHQLIPIDTLLKEPGRSQRPSQILIILRGLPGSGKSYVADLIKNEEEAQSKGQNKPKIHSIDSYFMTENQKETKDPKTGKITKTSVMEYEYDPKMEETYRRSLNKSIRKSIDDRFYPFLIVDQNNELLSHFLDLVEYAEGHQFRVYFVEMNRDVALANQRNIHQRSLADIKQIHERWEQLPLRFEILDIRSLLQSDAIDEVEMDDAALTAPTETEKEEEQEEEEESQITKKSKWEAMMETNPDRLDGLCQRRTQSSSSPIEKRLTTTMNFVEEPVPESSNNLQSKKKKVRWADIEENALHLHKKAVGFVVGQTEADWRRMSDHYDPSQKLNQYKYI